MTTDIAQNIADDGADAGRDCRKSDRGRLRAIGANRYRIDGGAAVADTACPDSDAGRAD